MTTTQSPDSSTTFLALDTTVGSPPASPGGPEPPISSYATQHQPPQRTTAITLTPLITTTSIRCEPIGIDDLGTEALIAGPLFTPLAQALKSNTRTTTEQPSPTPATTPPSNPATTTRAPTAWSASSAGPTTSPTPHWATQRAASAAPHSNTPLLVRHQQRSAPSKIATPTHNKARRHSRKPRHSAPSRLEHASASHKHKHTTTLGMHGSRSNTVLPGRSGSGSHQQHGAAPLGRRLKASGTRVVRTASKRGWRVVRQRAEPADASAASPPILLGHHALATAKATQRPRTAPATSAARRRQRELQAIYGSSSKQPSLRRGMGGKAGRSRLVFGGKAGARRAGGKCLVSASPATHSVVQLHRKANVGWF